MSHPHLNAEKSQELTVTLLWKVVTIYHSKTLEKKPRLTDWDPHEGHFQAGMNTGFDPNQDNKGEKLRICLEGKKSVSVFSILSIEADSGKEKASQIN